MLESSVECDAGGVVRLRQLNLTTRLSTQPGRARAVFSCVPNPSAQETCQGGENFCTKPESMFTSLNN